MTSFHLHPLKGDMKGFWSVTVRANWRIVFRFADSDADEVELIDYHWKGENAMPMKNPPHPGISVRLNCLEPFGLSVTEGAKVLGVSRTTLSRLINAQAGVSPDMAIRLAKAFGATPDIWIRMQAAYDLAQARQHEDDIKVKRYAVQPTVWLRLITASYPFEWAPDAPLAGALFNGGGQRDYKDEEPYGRCARWK
jgi:addiction module HigA family antidote